MARKIIERQPRTIEERENVLIGYAMDLAEQQLRDGTASSQTINHFLQLGSSMHDLEREFLIQKTNLHKTRVDAIKSSQVNEEKASKAVEALKKYSGRFGLEEIQDGELF